MNRLSPLVARRVGPTLAAAPRSGSEPFAGVPAAVWLEDLKQFATGWVGGLIFFGTLLG